MKDSKMIPIMKKYNREEVYQAVATYVNPSSDQARMTTETGPNFYIIKTEVLVKTKKEDSGEWKEACLVKLTFSESSCYVDVELIKGNLCIPVGLLTGSTLFFMSPFLGPALIPLALGGTVVSAGAGVASSRANKTSFKKFSKDIYDIVEGYLCVTRIQENKIIQETGASERKCECGAVLQDGIKFCPVCGKKAEDSQPGERKCECGAVLQDGAKFCGVCGKKVEERPQEMVCACGNILQKGVKFCPECGKEAAG